MLQMALPIPYKVWEDFSLNFTICLSKSQGFAMIMVVVDKLTKYYDMGTLDTKFNATMVAALFVHMVVHFHGFLRSVVLDRDPTFLVLQVLYLLVEI